MPASLRLEARSLEDVFRHFRKGPPMSKLLSPNAGPASLPRRILQQGRYETITMLRNGEQLILAVVLPLLALAGLTVTPLLDGLGGSRVDVATPGILALCAMSTAFTGGHCHGI